MPERRPVPDVPPPPRGWPAPHVPAPPARPVGSDPAVAAVGTGLATAAIGVYFLGQVVVGLVVGGVLVGAAAGAASDPFDPVLLLGAAVAGQIAGLGAALGLLRARRVALVRLIGPVRPVVRRVAAGIGVGAGTMLAASLLVALLIGLSGSEARPEQVILDEALAGGVRTALALTAAVILAPVAEELLFRGLLYPALRRRRGVAWAVAVSSLVFAVVHLDVAVTQPLALVGLAAVGVVLALARERSGGLLVPVVAHAAYNATALVVALAAQRSGLLELLGSVP